MDFRPTTGGLRLPVREKPTMASTTEADSRLLALAHELLLMVYEAVLLAPKTVSKKALLAPGADPDAYGLLRTSKQVYEVAIKVFWRNTFQFDVVRPPKVPSQIIIKPHLEKHLQSAIFTWSGTFSMKWKSYLRFLQKCENLKTLVVVIHPTILSADQFTTWPPKDQMLHRNEATIAEFRQLDGFDVLACFRGLKKVKVDASQVITTPPTTFARFGNGPVTVEKVAAFENFLNTVLTQRKPGQQSVT